MSFDRDLSGEDGRSHARDVPYDVFVDWDARLSRELPFFEALLERVGAARVVDVGCGSGMHAIALAKLGYKVVGIDPSESMLEAARRNAERAGVEVRFEQGVFEDTAAIAGEPVDVVLALGNGLPHVEGTKGLRRAFESFAAALRPGGALVLHLLNHERLIGGEVRMLAPKLRSTPDGDRVFVRLVDHVEGGFVFNFLTLQRDKVGTGETAVLDAEDHPWVLAESRSFHTSMVPSLLASELSAAGFGDMRMYGDHSGKPLDEAKDESVVVVAVR